MALVQTKAWLSKGRVCRAAIAVVEITSNSSLEDTTTFERSRMKVFVQLGAAVLAALAIVPTPGTEGAAISYGKRVKCAWHSPFFHGRIQNLTSLHLNF